MKLATRMSLFFLAALAVVLIGLSAAVYLLVRSQLHHQINERLITGLETFRGAMEFEPNGLDWEPDRRRQYFMDAQSTGPMVWGVFETNGRQIDGSADAPALFSDQIHPDAQREDGQTLARWQNQTWKIVHQTLRAPSSSDPPSLNHAAVEDNDDNRTHYAAPDFGRRHSH